MYVPNPIMSTYKLMYVPNPIPVSVFFLVCEFVICYIRPGVVPFMAEW